MSTAAELRAITRGLNMTAISNLIGCNRQTLANWLADQGAGINLKKSVEPSKTPFALS